MLMPPYHGALLRAAHSGPLNRRPRMEDHLILQPRDYFSRRGNIHQCRLALNHALSNLFVGPLDLLFDIHGNSFRHPSRQGGCVGAFLRDTPTPMHQLFSVASRPLIGKPANWPRRPMLTNLKDTAIIHRDILFFDHRGH